ncbi:MAG: hypothetical protein IPF57_09880 [Gammaproteobacteria bacterium]|nr:hypothetical protein [Gammaproteobacteria bacterium]
MLMPRLRAELSAAIEPHVADPALRAAITAAVLWHCQVMRGEGRCRRAHPSARRAAARLALGRRRPHATETASGAGAAEAHTDTPSRSTAGGS